MNNVFAERTHQAMADVLMSPNSLGPRVHYFMLRGGSDRKNITIWQSGTVGDEYIKTFGHYHVSDFLETYKIIFGEGIMLLQIRKTDKDGLPIDDEIESVRAIFVKEGKEVQIPKRAGHLIVNTGGSWLVTIDNSPVEWGKNKEAKWPKHADYEPIRQLHGFAYYVVNKNGLPFFIKNPNYKNAPEIVIEKA